MYFVEHQTTSRNEYLLKLKYGGEINSINKYVGGESMLVKGVSPNTCFTTIREIAYIQGYRNRFTLFTKSIAGKLETIKPLSMKGKFGASRVLKVYVTGNREVDQLEKNPIILAWNSASLNRAKIGMLKALIDIYGISIAFCMETRSSASRIGRLSYGLGFPDFGVSPVSGQDAYDMQDLTSPYKPNPNTKNIQPKKSNVQPKKNIPKMRGCVGLAVLWRGANVKLSEKTDNYFVLKISTDDGKIWRLIALYGHPSNKNLTITWLKKLLIEDEDSKIPTLVVGDVNNIGNESERSKAPTSLKNKAISNFQKCLDDCKLVDVPFEGDEDNFFTRMGTNGLETQIDKALATKCLLLMFPMSQVRHLTDKGNIFSDHIPIMIVTDPRVWKSLRVKNLREKIEYLILFVIEVGRYYPLCKIPTVAALLKRMGTETPDFYFGIVQNLIPHIMKVSPIFVFDENDQRLNVEQIVCLHGHEVLRELLWWWVDQIRQPKKYIEKSQQFPIFTNKRNGLFNFSEDQEQAWEILEKLSHGKSSLEKSSVVDMIIERQIENLLNVSEMIKNNRSLSREIGCEFMVCYIILCKVINGTIQTKGTIEDLFESVLMEYELYYGRGGKGGRFIIDQAGHCRAKIEDLLGRFKGIKGDDYEILDTQLEKTLRVLEGEMIETSYVSLMEVKLMDMKIDSFGKGKKEQKQGLLKVVDRKRIEGQIDMLKEIGCISISPSTNLIKNNIEDWDNVGKMQSRLRYAAAKVLDSFKKSSPSKTFGYAEYITRFKEVSVCATIEGEYGAVEGLKYLRLVDDGKQENPCCVVECLELHKRFKELKQEVVEQGLLWKG